MAKGLTQVRASIRQIDRQIDGVRRELMRRVVRFNTLSADAWQIAWDRNPDLRAMETTLFVQRGELQQQRNILEDEAYRAQLRRERSATRKAVKAVCITCGQSLAA